MVELLLCHRPDLMRMQGCHTCLWCSANTHLHPELAVQVGNPELTAGRMGEHLVVLLEDLVGALQHKASLADS